MRALATVLTAALLAAASAPAAAQYAPRGERYAAYGNAYEVDPFEAGMDQPYRPGRGGHAYGTAPQAAPHVQISPVPRELVEAPGRYAPGTIIISTEERRLYLVQNDGTAIRYGVGVGRPGFEWSGTKTITRKAEWPSWTPPAEMLQRRPDLPRYMKGGEDNPLGARAMYLGGSLYRIHGSNEPDTIGQAVSSGCIRMTNEDVVDLYNRVRVGTKVVVLR